MTRLHYSKIGYARLMQISKIQLFVFVEGRQIDSFFYGSLCSSALVEKIAFRIVQINQVNGGSGGKQDLIVFHDFLKKGKLLLSALAEKKTCSLFFADKDVDDILRRKKRSTHFHYTDYYDVQNYLFEHGDLSLAAASAASIDPQILREAIPEPSAWCRSKVLMWKEWVAVCVLVIKNNIHCECSYRRPSDIQIRPCNGVETGKFNSKISMLAGRMHLSEDAVRQSITAIVKKIERLTSDGLHHGFFKGKWYSTIIADEIDRIMSGGMYDKSGLSSKIPAALGATLNFDLPWASRLKQKVQNVACLL
jgi:hypothetical protein